MMKIIKKLLGFFKKLIGTTWQDSLIIIGSASLLLFVVQFLNYMVGGPDGNVFFIQVFEQIQNVIAFFLAVSIPRVLILFTFPKTIGKFVLDKFNSVWSGFSDREQFYITLGIYALLVLALVFS